MCPDLEAIPEIEPFWRCRTIAGIRAGNLATGMKNTCFWTGEVPQVTWSQGNGAAPPTLHDLLQGEPGLTSWVRHPASRMHSGGGGDHQCLRSDERNTAQHQHPARTTEDQGRSSNRVWHQASARGAVRPCGPRRGTTGRGHPLAGQNSGQAGRRIIRRRRGGPRRHRGTTLA